MSDSKVRDTVEVAKVLVDAVPVYQDLVQPGARELGEGIGGLIRVGLAPVTALVWGYERIRDFLERELEKKLSNVSPENVKAPDLRIAGPAVEALRFAADEAEIRCLFVNLIASSMDRDTAAKAHPSFIEIINQLSPDEALIIRYLQLQRGGLLNRVAVPLVDVQFIHQKSIDEIELPSWPGGERLREEMAPRTTVFRCFSLVTEKAGCTYPDMCASYLDNLSRLGVVYLSGNALADNSRYKELEGHQKIRDLVEKTNEAGAGRIVLKRRVLELTDFGEQFCDSCVDEFADTELER